MSGVLNDCDALLQAASVRVLNPANAWINLDTSAPGFHLTSTGVADLAVVTVTADLVGLDDAVSFSVVGGTLSNANGKSVDVTYTGSTAIVTATVVSGGEEFTRSCVIPVLRDGSSGATAKIVRLEASEEVFKITKAGANSPASITLTASGQNLGSSPNFTIPVGTATLTAGANGSQKILTFANMASDSVTIQVAQDGQTDRVTITKLREGADGIDAITGVLTNELVALPANNAGAVSSYTGADCTLKIYKGITEDTGWAFSFAPVTNAASLAYTTAGGTVTITGMAAGVDAAFVDITATKSGHANVVKRFNVTKSKAGATGSGTPGARGAGHYYAAGGAWSDGVADAATPDGNVVGDVVTISSGTFVMEKRWTGSAWVDNGVVINGKLIVPDSILTSSIAANAVQAKHIAAGAVKTSSLVVSGNGDNLIPDPRFKDLAWWGRPGHPVQQYGGVANYWRLGCTMVLDTTLNASQGAFKDSFTPMFTVTPGATYRVEYQSFMSGDFQGQVGIYLHIPQVNWYNMGAADIPGWAFAETGMLPQFASISAKGTRDVGQTFTIPVVGGDGKTVPYEVQLRITSYVTAGYLELGSFTLTRVSDSVLIKDGAVTASKMSVVQLDAMTARIGMLRTASSGARTEIKDNIIRLFASNGVAVVEIGDTNL
ncbi:hypothetical protein ACHAC9_22365 [Massilia sp. CMS3.1]|uniref:hypothetical protein n=1 Tax=Massilia sp. CMS3.1 TaxID=3373083 RepID=UPI003EE69B29